MARLPSLFVGSSAENLSVANEIQALLQSRSEVTIWNQGVFAPGMSFLEALADATARFDFAVMIANAVDVVERRGERVLAPRDNVMFELGLFMGALGRARTMFLFNRDDRPALPTDLAGVTCLTYGNRGDGNLRAALGPATTDIANIISRLGFRQDRRMDKMEEQIEQMVRLLVRSRKVEIDLIAQQFGTLIQPTFLAQLRKDVADLEASLTKKASPG
jgi:predicted nucleotide-binding protein